MWAAFFFFSFLNNAAVADATGILKHQSVTENAHANMHNLNIYQAFSKSEQNNPVVAGLITFASFWTTNQVMIYNRLTLCVVKSKSWLIWISATGQKWKAEPEATFLKGTGSLLMYTECCANSLLKIFLQKFPIYSGKLGFIIYL